MKSNHPAYARLAVILDMTRDGYSDQKIADALNCERKMIANARYALDIECGQLRRVNSIKADLKSGLSRDWIAERRGTMKKNVNRIASEMNVGAV